MIRRKFLKIISLSSLIPLLGLDKLFPWSNSVEPVTNDVLEFVAINNGDHFQLHWEDPNPIADAGPPTDWTWRKFLNDAYCEPDEELTEEYLEGHWDITIADLDKKCSQGCVEEWWWENGIDTTDRVFYYLQDMDLGDELHDQLEWYECPMIGSDYVGVEVRDEETLKKLEKKLNEQGESIRIKVINDWSELDQ